MPCTPSTRSKWIAFAIASPSPAPKTTAGTRRCSAISLRTDRRAYRRLSADDPMVVELREWSRMADDLQQERNRLANRVREQLWRYYPQMLKLTDDVAADWFLALWQCAPTPAKAAEAREAAIARILKAHRIRRFDAAASSRRSCIAKRKR